MNSIANKEMTETIRNLSNKNKNCRIVYADILKILASFAIVIIHVASKNFYNTNTDFQFDVFNFFSSFARWGVPIFVMVSGIFFLDPKKNITIKDVFSKYIKRMIIVLLFWNVIYAILYNMEDFIDGKKIGFNIIKDIFINRAPHLWYLYMLIGLYLIVPFLRILIKDEKVMRYFLILWICFEVIISVFQLFPLIDIEIKELLNNKMHINFIMGYSGYFILGYYLNKKKYINNKLVPFIFLFIIGGLLTFLGTKIISNIVNEHSETCYNNFFPNIFIMSLGIFIFIKELVNKVNISENKASNIAKIAKYSFGIYLVHPIIITFLNLVGISTLKFNPIIMMTISIILVYFISLCISVILNKMPLLNKIV